MARHRKKKRTHAIAGQNVVSSGSRNGQRPPKSLVIRMGAGEVGASLSRLARDFRAMMEPDTASRLRERKSNKLRDYTSMAGPLGVTHLFLFSRSKAGICNLRIALAPRGPTLHFQIERYSLCKDIVQSQKYAISGQDYKTPPLLVMNNFMVASNETDPDPVMKQLESLTTTIFQSMFPPISPNTTPLSSIKRVMLLNREKDPDGTFVLSLRHYAIVTKQTGVSKRVRRFDVTEQQKKRKGHELPNMNRLEDAADYILDPAAAGYSSASESGVDTDAEVEVLETSARKVLNKAQMQKMRDGQLKSKDIGGRSRVEKRAVKLVEIGPRMRLRLVRVEEGLCEGRVMWNEFINKTETEVKQLDEKWTQRRKEKEARKSEQKANVERKKQLKANTKANTKDGEQLDEDEEMDDFDSDDFDDEDDFDAKEDVDNGAMNGVSAVE